MTDFHCPECKKDVGKTAMSCPACGAVKPLSGWPENWFSKTLRERPAIGWPVGIAVLGVFGLFLYGGFMLLAAIVVALLH